MAFIPVRDAEKLLHLTRTLAAILGAGMLLNACGGGGGGYDSGGGGSGSGSGSGSGYGAMPSYTVGGTISGLSGAVVLQNNGGDNLAVSANGRFTFATQLADGSNYDVTVVSQPVGQSCTVMNGMGTFSASNVTTVTVTCR